MGRCLLAEDSVRWARCLAEVLALASQLCPASARAAYAHIVTRLQVHGPSSCTGPGSSGGALWYR